MGYYIINIINIEKIIIAWILYTLLKNFIKIDFLRRFLSANRFVIRFDLIRPFICCNIELYLIKKLTAIFI